MNDLNKTKWQDIAWMTGIIILVIFLLIIFFTSFTQAAGLVDETVDEENLYSLYPLDHYQLDFYVSDSWDWLPWNWNDGIGKQVMYGLYTITNFIWIMNLYVANATGYLVQQAYSLDFISDTANAIGENMQTLAGVSAQGFGEDGFYVGFLPLFILFLGIYVAYTGLLKRETTRAVRATLNFVVIFIISAAFIAFAPTYITKINEFSADISEASLDLGTKIVMPGSETQGKDSVDMIRNTLFSIQVEQPWLLLQFDDSDKAEIGEDRVDDLVSIDPNENNGETREDAVQTEIEDHDNQNLTITQVTNRLGMVAFLSLFNLGISIFVFLLTGIMIFSQILFIIFAMFLPISFLLSMMPTFEGMAKQAILKLFNVIMLRAGITLIITVAFSISSMIYSLTASYPFFLIAFLQIVTFAGIYMKLGDIMGMFRLQSSDSQQVGRKVMRRPQQMAYRGGRKVKRSVVKTLVGATAGGGTGAVLGRLIGQSKQNKRMPTLSRKVTEGESNQTHVKPDNHQSRPSLSQTLGQTTGKALDTKQRMKGNMQHRKQQLKDLPTSTKYALTQGKSKIKQPENDFKQGIQHNKHHRPITQTERTQKHRQNVMKQEKSLKQSQKEKQTSKDTKTGIKQHSKQQLHVQKNNRQHPSQNQKHIPVIHSQNRLPANTQLKPQSQTLYQNPRSNTSKDNTSQTSYGHNQKPRRTVSGKQNTQSEARHQRKQHHPKFKEKIPKHRQKRPLRPKRRERR